MGLGRGGFRVGVGLEWGGFKVGVCLEWDGKRGVVGVVIR